MMLMMLQGASASGARAHFRCSFTAILPISLQFDSYFVLLLCCLACSAAFVDFYCLCRLALPLSDFAVVVGYADFAYWMSQLADPINCSALQLDFRIPTNSVPV